MIVSYLRSVLADSGDAIDEARYPSLGSFIDFRLMYSSYSKSPAILLSSYNACTLRSIQTIEFGMLPVERQFSQEKVDVIS